MRKHRSTTVDQIQEIARLSRELYNAKIGAAVVEWLQTLALDPDDVDTEQLKLDIAESKRGGFPRMEKKYATVSDVPTAKGNFSF